MGSDYQRKVLVNGVDQRLKESIRPTSLEVRASVIELEIMPDPLQLLCEVDPQLGMHRAIKSLESRPSRLLRQGFACLRLPAPWMNSCCVPTVGGAYLAVIQPSIQNRKSV
jgi:REP-associated tyrosine transposase